MVCPPLEPRMCFDDQLRIDLRMLYRASGHAVKNGPGKYLHALRANPRHQCVESTRESREMDQASLTRIAMNSDLAQNPTDEP